MLKYGFLKIIFINSTLQILITTLLAIMVFMAETKPKSDPILDLYFYNYYPYYYRYYYYDGEYHEYPYYFYRNYKDTLTLWNLD